MQNDAAAYKTTIVDIVSRISELQDQISKLQLKHDETKAALEGLVAKGKTARAEVDKLVDPDLDSFQEKLNNIDTTNQAVRAARDYKTTKAKMNELEAQSSDLTAQMQAIDDEKDKMLKEATLPIDGLGFDEIGVTFKGIPFKQCSSAERLRVSVAMAMALNPNLRVIRITDASLLDDDSMAMIEKMSDEKDFQVWYEVVDSSGTLGVYIEDGEVKN
jgi:hypothetical protein